MFVVGPIYDGKSSKKSSSEVKHFAPGTKIDFRKDRRSLVYLQVFQMIH